MFLEVLLEGASDVPVVRDVLERRFGLVENQEFRLHPHRGRGRLPEHPNRPPDPRRRGLLDQLPAKLRGYAGLPPDSYCVVVLVDADRDDCRELKRSLVETCQKLSRRPACVLFRIAVEETESWFLADREAIAAAYPKNRMEKVLKGHTPDAVVGSWELLARVLGQRPEDCGGGDKIEWAERLAPHLDLDHPRSPSLGALIQGIQKILG